MTDDELKAILEKCDHNDNESYMESCFDVSDDARALVAEVRRLDGMIARAGLKCIAETGWCAFCDGHHVAIEDWMDDCPAFTEGGDVR